MRRALALFLILLPLQGHAQPAAPTVIDAIRANQWAQADALAAAEPDPLVRRLVLYYRLLTPGAARAAEIAAFMSDSPDWPNQAVLSRRLQDALVTDRDDRTVLDICLKRPPTAPPTMLRCADAASRAGLPENDSPARRAWLAGPLDAAAEAAFLKRWGAQLTPDDQWQRFDRLAWTLPATPGSPAARQALRLAPSQRPAAEARLALKRDDPTAPALFAALASPHDPTLVLELARWYRRAGQDKDAANVWATLGPAAEQAAPLDRRAAFWDERNLLARRLLRANEPALAYAVAAPQAASPEGALDQSFLAGWIALRRLNDPALARQHFSTLATLSRAALTQSRAHYWLGRTFADDPAARAEYDQAALWPTTYYGQLAILARGNDPAQLATLVAAAHDPTWSDDRAIAFLAHDPARAAVLLAAWGEPRRAKAFLARLDETAADPAERALAARLALGLGVPEQAVAIARRAGRDGVMLPASGWPTPVAVPPGPLEPALVLGLIRQESSFDVQALSPVGARGLMQLMPATAAETARRANLPMNLDALTTDATYNIRLGTVFLQGLLTRFHQALPLAIAGYNAGPGRVQDWLVAQDLTAPGTSSADVIDWIELIPFNETRNYVQRVIENIVVYRAQRGDALPHPVEPAPQQAAIPG